jgi:hypothetical protein
MSSATYPNGVKVWSPRVNQRDDVEADDVNSLAAEIIAIQTTLGLSPAIDTSVNGDHIDHQTVSQRLHDIQSGYNRPVVRLEGNAIIPNAAEIPIDFAAIAAQIDSDGAFDGVGITIPRSGWWVLTGDCRWPINTNGFRLLALTFSGTNELSGQTSPGTGFFVRTSVSWQGNLTKGAKIRLNAYQNSGASMTIDQVSLSGSMIRDL